MGTACGVPESAQRTELSATIDKTLKADYNDSRHDLRVLLLGTTASGKSTVTKQMKLLHCTEGFTEEERKNYKNILMLNLFLGMKELILEAEKRSNKIAHKHRKIVKFYKMCNPYSPGALDEDMVTQTKELWKDKGISKTYAARNEFDLSPNTGYCLKNIDRISHPDFSPSKDDILQARQRTTGIVETKFKRDKINWTILDVGGQRTERRKWIHCFADRVHAIIYVAALDEFDVVEPEEPSLSKMEESLAVFEKVMDMEIYQEICVLLFLNKIDLFKTKIQQVDMSKTFPEYKGGPDFDKSVEFINQLYLNRVTKRKEPVYVHATCAINSRQISEIFEQVMNTIYKARLRASGLGL